MKKKKTTSALSLKTLSKRTRQKESTSILKKVVKGTKKSSGPSPGKVSPGKIRLKTGAFPIVGIGASAGGLEACTQLLRHLPPDSGMAFVLVQHLDPKHKSILRDLLAKATSMSVSEVKGGMPAEPNHVYVIPPNTEMVISRTVLVLTPRAEIHGFHMPIDQFFHSLAEDQKNNAIGVILSGTASDGALGLKAIKMEGGITFAQDEKTAKYSGMPHSAIAHGAVDFILPPEKIAKELVRIGRHSYLSDKISIAQDNFQKAETGDLPPQDENNFSQILTLLLSSSRVDFTDYKQATIKRRIARRMVIHRLESMSDYLKYLHENPAEVEALYQDILIHVTGFFRDPETFEALKKAIFPMILNQRSPEVPLRVWVPGCSTGEEAYSLAISLFEFLGEKSKNFPIQIFATDISETTLEKARTGKFGENIQRDVSAKRLQRFFIRVDSGYQISKFVRDLCVFAKQDLAKDPPFSNLDLISCRNVLIYMNASLQKRVMGIFHYALRPTGYLLLGRTENIVGYAESFALVDKKQKIYSRKMSPIHPDFSFTAGGYELKKVDVIKKMGDEGFDIEKEANRIVLSRYAPAGVIANEHMDILHFRGHTGSYIEPSPGEASLNLFKMAREGLRLDIRAAIHDAKRKATAIRKEGLQVRQEGQYKEVNIEVIPIKSPPGERYFLILFEDVATPVGEAEIKIAIPAGTKAKPAQKPRKEYSKIVQLEQEIASTRKYLQSIIEEQETTNEEIRAANEEILSSNEEFQSINEELETAREELQSTNEELTTLNEELQNRNAELGQLNNDMINLFGSVDLPVVMLGGDLHIRRFTPAAGKALNLTSTDIGRSISDIKLGIDIPDLELLVIEVIKTVGIKEMEVLNREGRWYSLRIRPYTTADHRIDGAVLILVDIDVLIKSLEEVKESRDYARAIVETVREPLVILDKEQRVKTANRSFYRTFQVKPEETENRLIYDLGNRQWNIPGLRVLLEEILPEKTSFQDFEVEHDISGIGHRTLLLNARQINQHDSGSQMILLAIEDITERKQAEKQIRNLNNHLLMAQELERARIAGDIHDSLGASLAAIKFRADSLIQESHRCGNHVLISGLDTINRMVQENIDEVRRLQQNLRPPLLDDLGILTTVEWFCREFQTTYPDIRIEKLIDSKEEEVPQSLKIVIFRIIQEALSNVAKHGRADLVDLSLGKSNGKIELSVRDNGQGFDVNKVLSEEDSRRGLGLTRMKERTIHSGGTFTIDSAKGKGTVIRASWPSE